MPGFGVVLMEFHGVLPDFEPVLHDFGPKISLFLDKNQLFCIFSLGSLEQKWVYKGFGEFQQIRSLKGEQRKKYIVSNISMLESRRPPENAPPSSSGGIGEKRGGAVLVVMLDSGVAVNTWHFSGFLTFSCKRSTRPSYLPCQERSHSPQ